MLQYEISQQKYILFSSLWAFWALTPETDTPRFSKLFPGMHFYKISSLWWRVWTVLAWMPIHFTCPPLQVCLLSASNSSERGLHNCPLPQQYSSRCIFDYVSLVHGCVAHPLRFQQFQNVDVSFPSLSLFSLFIGKHFWLFSRLWLLGDGLIGSAGKSEQFSVFTSVPSLGTGCWPAANFLLFGQIPILKQYSLHHLPWSHDPHFSQMHDDGSMVGISFCWSLSFQYTQGLFISLKWSEVSLSLLSLSWTNPLSRFIISLCLALFIISAWDPVSLSAFKILFSSVYLLKSWFLMDS